MFIEIGKHGEIETCLMAIRQFFNDTTNGGVRPAGWVPPQKVLAGLMEIMQS